MAKKMLKIGSWVTRNSYGNDIIFEIENIVDNVYYLKGINVRLYADSNKEDLELYNDDKKIDDTDIVERVISDISLDRNDFFYLPGKILHIDGDKSYLDRCLDLYTKSNVLAFGIHEKESDMPLNVGKYLEDINPDILVITGHDAYYNKKGNINDIKAYKKTDNFVKAVIEARKYEKAHDKLIIIAGA